VTPRPIDLRTPPNERSAIARDLDREFAEWADQLTPEQRVAIATYQDDGYKLVNRSLRSPRYYDSLTRTDRYAVQTIRLHLDAAIDAGRTQERLFLFRGLHSIEATLGYTGPLSDLVGQRRRLLGYSSCSLSQQRALRFASRPFGALLRLNLSPGSRGAWVSLVSADAYKTQEEFLLPHLTDILITDTKEDDRLPLIHAEVTHD
jgi:hypothetical protein